MAGGGGNPWGRRDGSAGRWGDLPRGHRPRPVASLPRNDDRRARLALCHRADHNQGDPPDADRAGGGPGVHHGPVEYRRGRAVGGGRPGRQLARPDGIPPHTGDAPRPHPARRRRWRGVGVHPGGTEGFRRCQRDHLYPDAELHRAAVGGLHGVRLVGGSDGLQLSLLPPVSATGALPRAAWGHPHRPRPRPDRGAPAGGTPAADALGIRDSQHRGQPTSGALRGHARTAERAAGHGGKRCVSGSGRGGRGQRRHPPDSAGHIARVWVHGDHRRLGGPAQPVGRDPGSGVVRRTAERGVRHSDGGRARRDRLHDPGLSAFPGARQRTPPTPGAAAPGHALLTVTLGTEQVTTGLSLALFGTGLSAFLGKPFIGIPNPVPFRPVPLPGLAHLPILGPVFFQQDLLVYTSYVFIILAWWWIYRTRPGLHLRACGESPETADAMGVDVTVMRYGAVIVGGALAGLAGGYLSLAYTPAWTENMTAGLGWIAIALVIFSTWNPLRLLGGAYLFGAADALGFRVQLLGVETSSILLRMLPYLFTLVVLVLINAVRRHSPVPRALGRPYFREE